MADKDETEESPSLATSRSRRGPSKKRSAREEALSKLKASKEKKWSYEVEEEMTDNVYDLVDEKKYADRVKERLDDDFIVDDDGEYADDGREIFDEDEDAAPDRSGPRKAARKREEERKKEAKKRGNIKNMLLNMPTKKGGDKEDQGLQNDEVLASLLGEIKANKPAVKKATSVATKKVAPVAAPAGPSRALLAPSPQVSRPSNLSSQSRQVSKELKRPLHR